MNTGTHAQEGVSAVPLLNAVFCAGCETISNSPHEVCIVCGSRSLTSLSRLLGSKLESRRPRAGRATYDLEVMAKVREVPAAELNYLVQSITRLAAAGELERLHINVESFFETEGLIRAA